MRRERQRATTRKREVAGTRPSARGGGANKTLPPSPSFLLCFSFRSGETRARHGNEARKETKRICATRSSGALRYAMEIFPVISPSPDQLECRYGQVYAYGCTRSSTFARRSSRRDSQFTKVTFPPAGLLIKLFYICGL